MQTTPSLHFKPVFAIGAIDATSTQTSAAIDSRGFDYALLLVNLGVLDTTATLVVKVQECDTSGGTYTDITSATFTVDVDADDASVAAGQIRLHGRERYLKVVGTYGGSASVAFSATLVLTGAQYTADDASPTMEFSV